MGTRLPLALLLALWACDEADGPSAPSATDSATVDAALDSALSDSAPSADGSPRVPDADLEDVRDSDPLVSDVGVAWDIWVPPDLAVDASPLDGAAEWDVGVDPDVSQDVSVVGPDARVEPAPDAAPDAAPDMRVAECGDGVVDDGEACDDGNEDEGDACFSDCTLRPWFYEAPLYAPTGEWPAAVAAGDLDGDGDTDLVTADAGSGTVTILLNGGRGRFDSVSFAAGGAAPNALALGDLDGDEDLDLAVLDIDASALIVFSNDGSANFDEGAPYVTTLRPTSVVAADMNGDQRIDLVVAAEESGEVMVHRNAGDGTLRPGRGFASDALLSALPAAIDIADINGDRLPDVLLASRFPSGLVVLPGVGAGALGAPRVFPAAEPAYTVRAVDLDGDDVADVALGDENDLVVYLNDGAGDLGEGALVEVGRWQSGCGRVCGMTPKWIGADDVDDDGDTDLLVVDLWELTVAVLRNDGGGDFDRPARSPAPYAWRTGTGWPMSSAAMGDVDGDGRLDVVIAWRSHDRVLIRLGTSEGGVVHTDRFEISVNTAGFAVADLDGDQDLDVVHGARDTLRVFSNDGAAGFGDSTVYAAGSGLTWIAVGDLDGDRDIDIVGANRDSEDLSVWSNDGQGRMGDPVAIPNGPSTECVQTADIDGDGDLDLIANSRRSIMVHHNRGDATFEAPVELWIAARGWGWPRFVAVGDLNGDGDLDLLAANWSGDTLSALLNDGEGGFEPPVESDAVHSPLIIELGDLNGDGVLDAAVYNQWANNVSLHMGDGSGRFGAPQLLLDAGERPEGIEIADLDGDGDNDLVIADSETSTLRPFINDGRGHLSPAARYAVPPWPKRIVAADVDGDGALDLLTGGRHLNVLRFGWRP